MRLLFAATTAALAPELRPGQAVHVNARAAWLPATVTSIAHTRIGVTYHIRTTHPLSDAVAPWVVRPADGIRLCAVYAVRAGDEIVAFDGTVHTVTNTWRSRDG